VIVNQLVRSRGVSTFIDAMGFFRQVNREVMPLILNMLCAATGLAIDESETCNGRLHAPSLLRAVNLRRGRRRCRQDYPAGVHRHAITLSWLWAGDGRPLPETLRRRNQRPIVAGLWSKS